MKYLNTTSKMINLYMSNINNIRNGDKRLMLTEYINSKLSINWREESIHKVNKPPSYIKSNCYWKQDDTANKPRVRNCCIEQNKHVSTKTAYSYKLQIQAHLATYLEQLQRNNASFPSRTLCILIYYWNNFLWIQYLCILLSWFFIICLNFFPNCSLYIGF